MDKFVVSLKDSERRHNFDLLFSGMDYKFFDAIQPKNDDPKFDQFIANALYGRSLRKGEIGCTLSHIEIIKRFSSGVNDSEWLLVMEDDALPEIHFFDFIRSFPTDGAIMNRAPAILLLGHSKTSKRHLWIQHLKQPLYMKEYVGGVLFGQNKRITLCGTVSYLINKEAAKIISKCGKPFWMADDWHLFSNLGITIKHPVKPLIYEDLSYASSTDNELRYHHDFFKHPLSNIADILISRYRYYNDLRKGV